MFFEIFGHFLKWGAGIYAAFLVVGIFKGESLDVITLSDGTVERGLVLKGAVLVFLLVVLASAVVSAFGGFVEGYEVRTRTKTRKEQPWEKPMEYMDGEVVEEYREEDELPELDSMSTRRAGFLSSGEK